MESKLNKRQTKHVVGFGTITNLDNLGFTIDINLDSIPETQCYTDKMGNRRCSFKTGKLLTKRMLNNVLYVDLECYVYEDMADFIKELTNKGE